MCEAINLLRKSLILKEQQLQVLRGSGAALVHHRQHLRRQRVPGDHLVADLRVDSRQSIAVLTVTLEHNRTEQN